MHGGAAPADRRAELGAREVRTALADLDCRDGIRYSERMRAVRFEAEARFPAELQDVIEAVKLVAASRR